jgi:exopolysaccharide production protein ExoZ
LKVPPALAAGIAAGGFLWLLLGFPPVAAGPKILFLLNSVLPAATVVFGVGALDLANRVKKLAGFELLGDASYSIYLSHIFSLGIARALWVKAGLAREVPLAAAGFAIFSCLLAVVVAVFVYRWVELPMLVRLQKAYQLRRTRRLEAARA